jgi:uracil-DNA glycosylase family 4
MTPLTLQDLNSELLACRRCPRLVAWREVVAHLKRRTYQQWDYWGKPVPGFGDPRARVMAVGLAPGAHGSNRTGRMFTGDASGDFLYPALYRQGFASQPASTHMDDGLTLKDIYITSVCRCAPPQNKPRLDEMANCQPYLERELAIIQPVVLVALGRIAFERLLRLNSAPPGLRFTHGAVYRLDGGIWLFCSYHPSRQNTQTRRLTVAMFDQVWSHARSLLETI